MLDDTVAPTAADPWSALATAETAEQLCVAWLQVLCSRLLDAESGLVLLAQADGAFVPAATYPAGQDVSALRGIATGALRSRDLVVQADDPNQLRLAYPLLSAARLHGVVVLELGRVPAAEVDRAVEWVMWGAGWLIGLLHQRELAEQQLQRRQGGVLIDTLLGLLAERTPREAALALVNRMGREFDSHQVHLAMAHGTMGPGAMSRGKTLRVLAISHAAWFEERARAVLLATQAMHEALDQRRRIVWPEGVDGAGHAAGAVSVAHRRYADEAGAGALVSLPLLHGGQVAGVLMLERRLPFTPAELGWLERLVAGLAPALVLQHEAHQGAAARWLRSARRGMAAVLGPRYPALKLGAAVAALGLVLMALVPAPFRISAQALVEGAVQRAAVAPFDGYLRQAPARAGDIVKAGQVLAVLDDRDLKLERTRWEAELEVAQRKEREAMAAGNAVEQRLAGAQANQTRAQLDLALSRLARVTVTAPFDGTVVKGDLSQQLGSPVEQGKLLFELAPLDAWRVILKVDERDIGHVRVGAPGELLLASLPGRAWPFTVKKLTPVLVAEDGRNHFRVEAELAQGAPQLSPNMEGVGKVNAGRASLLWIWSRPLIDWLRLAWWQWVP